MSDNFDEWLAGREEEPRTDDGILSPGTVVGSYTIVALLGSGGFADVYRAKTKKGGKVAIKILHRLDEKSRRRFEREAEILSQVWHPNFPKLLGFGMCGERPYLVTELLRHYQFPGSDRKIARFLRQIISAVSALHRAGYVHRDIKPANVLAREDGTPVLIDFGLVCPVSSVKRKKDGLSIEEGQSVGVGTAGYSAPEQFTGAEVGPEADIHALGMLIKECFSKKLPRCWQRIYLTATNSDPSVRYHSAAELKQAIIWRHSRKYWLAGGIAALILVAVGLTIWLHVVEGGREKIENSTFEVDTL